jgi:hypothetical protein
MNPITPQGETMSDNLDIVTTDDTNDDTNVTQSFALEVGKELATTVAGCVVALALTSGASVLVNKVRARRAAKKSDDDNTDTVAHAA